MMRVGTIFQNLRSIGFESYFLYTGGRAYKGKGNVPHTTEGYGLTKHGRQWRLQKVCYAISDLEDPRKFKVVGCIDLEQVTTAEMMKALGIEDES